MADIRAQAHHASEQPFRFLDLPKDIRLMVYDFLPIVARRQYVQIHTLIANVDIVTQCIAGWPFLTSCRLIFAEAASTISTRIKSQPVRIVADWVYLNGWPFNHVLRCAGLAQDCHCTSLRVAYKSEDVSMSRYPPPAYNEHVCDSGAHRQLHNMVTYTGGTTAIRRVELAIPLDGWLNEDDLGPTIRHFYEFVYDMGSRHGVHKLDLILRPVSVDETPLPPALLKFIARQLEEQISCQENVGAWTCILGPEIQKDEWNSDWAALEGVE